MFLILGILLAATAVDANGCLFPLAHAVIAAEKTTIGCGSCNFP